MATKDSIFSTFDPRRHAVTLRADWYQRHGHGGKSGAEIASAFEIQATIRGPEAIMRSKKDATALIHVKRVGELNGESWSTCVVTTPAEALNSHLVATAYNARHVSQKGERVWPEETP
jgi:hypothetical protein